MSNSGGVEHTDAENRDVEKRDIENSAFSNYDVGTNDRDYTLERR